jgi:hypothetical protein
VRDQPRVVAVVRGNVCVCVSGRNNSGGNGGQMHTDDTQFGRNGNAFVVLRSLCHFVMVMVPFDFAASQSLVSRCVRSSGGHRVCGASSNHVSENGRIISACDRSDRMRRMANLRAGGPHRPPLPHPTVSTEATSCSGLVRIVARGRELARTLANTRFAGLACESAAPKFLRPEYVVPGRTVQRRQCACVWCVCACRRRRNTQSQTERQPVPPHRRLRDWNATRTVQALETVLRELALFCAKAQTQK